MKRLLLIICACLALLASPNMANAEVTSHDATSVVHYGCGGHRPKKVSDAYTYNGYEDFVYWDIEYNEGVLSLTWNNIDANCCPEGFASRYEIDDDNIIFYLDELFGEYACTCSCHFDITTTFDAIAPGHYTVTFFGSEVTEEIDLSEGFECTIKNEEAAVTCIDKTEFMHITSDGTLHITTDGKYTGTDGKYTGTDSEYTLEIYDASGIRFADIRGEGPACYHVNTLPTGIYTAVLTTSGTKSTLRFSR